MVHPRFESARLLVGVLAGLFLFNAAVRAEMLPTPGGDEAVVTEAWPQPVRLLEMLEGLSAHEGTSAWARDVAQQVQSLGVAVSDRSASRTEEILSNLFDLGSQADRLAEGLADRQAATQLLRVQHALGRRLDLWRQLIQPGEPLTESWKLADPTSGRQITAAELLGCLERYESTGLNNDAQPLAEICRLLGDSADESNQQLNRRLQTHYRNANLRIAVTGELLNGLVPKQESQEMRVRDTVLGNPVRGRSTNESEVTIRLIPDDQQLRMALEVEGEISSQTTTTAGPATFHTNSKSIYRASKEMELGTFGVRAYPTEVAVDNRAWLRSWGTSMDNVPVLGALAHNRAKTQHDRSQSMADREVENKVAARVRRQFDEEAATRMKKLDALMQERILSPLTALALNPVTVSAETTDQRLTTRLRLAADNQLGSSTPRPEAPIDSLLSLQVHQSALDNVFDQLELGGNTFTLGELRHHVAKKLNRPEPTTKTEDDDNVVITFARRDPVHVQFVDSQVVITLSITELEAKDRDRYWSDFQVRVFYRPETNERTVQLVRDGVVQVIGDLNLGSQVALRGIFVRIFHKDRPWTITPEALETNPVYAETAVTQLVLDDGWFGFALSPAPSEEQVARR